VSFTCSSFSGSFVSPLSGLFTTRGVRLLLSSLLVLSLSFVGSVVWTQSVLAEPAVNFNGVYSYCEGSDFLPVQDESPFKPAESYTPTGGTNSLSLVEGNQFIPQNNICIGIGLDDQNDVIRGNGDMSLTDGARTVLGTGQVLRLRGRATEEVDVRGDFDISIISDLLDNTSNELSLTSESQIIAADLATGMRIQLAPTSEEDPSDVSSYISMMKVGDGAKVLGVAIDLITSNESEAAILVVGASDVDFVNSPVSGTGGPGLRLVVFDSVDHVSFRSSISGSVKVVVKQSRVVLGQTSDPLTQSTVYFPNQYTGGTYILSDSTVEGAPDAFGSGPIRIEQGGGVELASISPDERDDGFSNDFRNDVIGFAGGDGTTLGGKLQKGGTEEISFHGRLHLIELLVVEGSAKLVPGSDASTSIVHVGSGATLDLGGVTRTLGGLHTLDTNNSGTGKVVGGSGTAEIELVLDVDDNFDEDSGHSFDGHIVSITSLTKKGKGTQRLYGKVYSTSSTDDEGEMTFMPIPGPVTVNAYELHVDFDTLVGADVILGGSSDGSDHAELVVRNVEAQTQSFTSSVTTNPETKGTLSKVGVGSIRFTGNLAPSLFHIKQGMAMLHSEEDQIGMSGTVVQIDGADTDAGILSLEGINTLIAGLTGGSGNQQGKLIGFSDETAVENLPELTISVPATKAHEFIGDIERVREIILDGHGTQTIKGKVRRTADAHVSEDARIATVKSGVFVIDVDTFKYLNKAPLYVDDGAILYIYVSDEKVGDENVFENPIEGSGGLKLSPDMKLAGDLDTSSIELILYNNINLAGDRTFAGLISEDQGDETLVLSNHDDISAYTLTLDVPDGNDPVFKGLLDKKVHLIKEGTGKHTLAITDGHEGSINVNAGYLSLEVRPASSTPNQEGRLCAAIVESCINSDIDIAADANLHLLFEAKSTEFTKKITIPEGAEVMMTAPEPEEHYPHNKITYSYAYSADDISNAEVAGSGELRLSNVHAELGGDISTKENTFLIADLTILEGTTITGNGVIKGLVVLKGGVLSPGQSSGEVSSDGWVLDSGSYYVDVEHDTDTAWNTDVITTVPEDKGVTIKDASLVLRNMEDNPTDSESYEGTKAIIKKYKTGRFWSIDASDFKGTMQPVVTYQGPDEGSEEMFGEVLLSWEPFEEDRFETFAVGSNHKMIGAYIDSLGPESDIYNILLAKDESDVTEIMEALSGEVYAAAAGVYLKSLIMVEDVILKRMQVTSLYDKLGCLTARDECESIGTGLAVWDAVAMNYGTVSETETSTPKLKTSGIGGILASDMIIGAGRAGMVMGLSSSVYELLNANESTNLVSKGEFMSYYLGMYATRYFGKSIEIRGSVLVASHVSDVSREVSLESTDFSGDLSANYSSYGTRFTGELVRMGSFYFTSRAIKGVSELFFRIERSMVSREAFSEEGDLKEFMLLVDRGSYTESSTVLGGRWSMCFGCRHDGFKSISLNYMFGWSHRWGGKDPIAKIRFSESEGSMSYYSISSHTGSRDEAIFGLGFLMVNPGAYSDISIALDGVGRLSIDSFNAGASIRVRKSFP